jgi:hypothetical protein
VEPLELVFTDSDPEELTKGRYRRSSFVLRYTSEIEHRHSWQREDDLVGLSSDVELKRLARSLLASDRE